MHRICKQLATAALALALATPAFTQELKPQTLKMANFVPEGSWFGRQHKWWAAELEKRSGGKLKVQIFWVESLAKLKDALPAIQSGVADLASVSSTYFPSQFPGYLMLDNLFNFGDDYVAAVLAALDTAENEPNLKAELARADIIKLMSHISGHAPIGTKTELKSIKDLKGKSLRTYGGVRTQFYTNIGANPIFMSFPDMYEAINRGTIDALGDMAIVVAHAFKHYEVVRAVYTNAPPGVSGNGGALASGFFMSQKKFNAFPKDTQKMLMDLRRDYGVHLAQGLMNDESVIRNEWQTKHGVKFFNPSPEDAKYIQQAGDAANEQLIKKQEADGHKNVRQVWTYYLNARQKHEAERKKK